MSFLSRLMNTFRISDENDDDDYYLDDEEAFEEEEKPRRGFLGRRTEEDDYDDDYDSKPRFNSRNNKVVPMRRSNMEVRMIKPTSMEDSREVCDYLLGGKAVVLNMEGLPLEIAQRIIDFTSGATYSIGGNLQKISNYIFIATPQSVELSGDFQDLLSASTNSAMAGVSGLNVRM